MTGCGAATAPDVINSDAVFEGANFTVFLSADGLEITMKGIADTAWTADLLA